MPGGRPGEGPPMMMVPMMMPPQQPPVGDADPNQMSPPNQMANCAPQPMGMMMVGGAYPNQMSPQNCAPQPGPMEQCMLGPNGMPCSPAGATSPMSAMDRYTQ